MEVIGWRERSGVDGTSASVWKGEGERENKKEKG